MEDISTTPKITDILEMLGDGKWHALDEIRLDSKLHKDRIRKIIEFLKEYEFITMDENEARIRLSEEAQKFLIQKTTA